ncbi:hypothetical protein AKO1_006262 [Acrasis kona]|uniref:Uncharacterized protein n=1 Tax=Acrasis kona TaxID=1008807 RepID=A0AAW2YHV9_9EUKA
MMNTEHVWVCGPTCVDKIRELSKSNKTKDELEKIITNSGNTPYLTVELAEVAKKLFDDKIVTIYGKDIKTIADSSVKLFEDNLIKKILYDAEISRKLKQENNIPIEHFRGRLENRLEAAKFDNIAEEPYNLEGLRDNTYGVFLINIKKLAAMSFYNKELKKRIENQTKEEGFYGHFIVIFRAGEALQVYDPLSGLMKNFKDDDANLLNLLKDEDAKGNAIIISRTN